MLVNDADKRADRHLFHEGNFPQVIPELRLQPQACWPAVKFNFPMDKVSNAFAWRHVFLPRAVRVRPRSPDAPLMEQISRYYCSDNLRRPVASRTVEYHSKSIGHGRNISRQRTIRIRTSSWWDQICKKTATTAAMMRKRNRPPSLRYGIS